MNFFKFLCLASALALAAPALAQNASRTRLVTHPYSSKAGQTVKLVAEVDGLGGGAPTGTVSFAEGAVALGAGILSPYGAGQATLAGGSYHTCVLGAASDVQCWGDNSYGQLGDGTITDRYSPVAVSGLSSGVLAIVAGAHHTCALTAAGAVACWGPNYFGMLGDGTGVQRLTPVAVQGLSSGVVAIAAGGLHTCALTIAGAVKCWGSNAKGQLGDGTKLDRYVPVAVQGLSSGVVAIAAGAEHSCALTSVGAVKCWGSNEAGAVGDGTSGYHLYRLVPVAVSGLSRDIVAISAGNNHTCALTAARAVKCWGLNTYGELGDGTTTSRNIPVPVSGLSSGVVAISTGATSQFNCALKGGGGVLCWGRNHFGELGDLSVTDRSTPVAVAGHTRDVDAIALGKFHTCISIGSGIVRCWGRNNAGQLGDGTIANRRSPAPVPGFTALIRARATMLTHSLGVGAHQLLTSFQGDALHTPSSGATWHTVNP
ncbi:MULTISPECIES: regulator of chromosome condensation RCC1 [Methylosinus]|uniref:Chromosome condensation regulator RCC1 n=1 Tax=Methylosinus trichosporium (strain ATCC 35070 / NCIMB 11131 / UNIQEM 75 / OB3b) TaxID=595536 RepID=A0A2D2CV72_METT3|nr:MULTISPECIES: regulator of chromosome condensation RCC1 [Methylosinus]ATQ66633.1 chromosome condensation regulator RCC1 [Methylosinus trichosporium OB3b]OBS51715.1 hypothetical protein A8B73_14915 [Methylosinus sp. 3S-1]